MTEQLQIALIASGSALAGVLVAAAISTLVARSERQNQNRHLLRKKYEEMTLSFTESMGWLSKINRAKSKDEIFGLSYSPEARKSLSLCLLYFPELVEDANDYVLAIADYFAYVTEVFDSSAPANVGGQAVAHGPGVEEMEKLQSAKSLFEHAIVRESRRYAIPI